MPKMDPIMIPARGTLPLFALSSLVESRVLMVDLRVDGARRNNGKAETEEAPKSSSVDACIILVYFYLETSKSSGFVGCSVYRRVSSVAPGGS